MYLTFLPLVWLSVIPSIGGGTRREEPLLLYGQRLSCEDDGREVCPSRHFCAGQRFRVVQLLSTNSDFLTAKLHST